MAIIMTWWIGNGAVLKSSSQLQFKEFMKLNNSVHELFIFKILVQIRITLMVASKLKIFGTRVI